MHFTLCLFSHICDYEDKYNLTRTDLWNLERTYGYADYTKIVQCKCCDVVHYTKETAAYLTDC